jgi:hypothetical protein
MTIADADEDLFFQERFILVGVGWSRVPMPDP